MSRTPDCMGVSVVSCQLSVVSRQSSVVSRQLAVVSWQWSVVCRQWSALSRFRDLTDGGFSGVARRGTGNWSCVSRASATISEFIVRATRGRAASITLHISPSSRSADATGEPSVGRSVLGDQFFRQHLQNPSIVYCPLVRLSQFAVSATDH